MEFLTPSELVRLTDYKSAKKQIKTLVGMGIPFTLTLHGKPKVLRSALEAIYFVNGKPVNPEKNKRRTEPNLGAFRESTQRR